MIPRGSFVYRGEGNAHIVVALPNERRVLRFRKSLPGEESKDSGKVRVEKEVDFVRDVASRFLDFYVRVPEIVRYDKETIAQLSDSIQHLRPEKRRYKEIVEEYATKYPDYAFLRQDWPVLSNQSLYGAESPTFCVEIKPKQGFIGSAADLPFGKCPYCLMQYYKLERGDIANRSNYCPLDLFSGEEKRIESAIRALFESPQNNLKVFKDGQVVYDQDSTDADLERVCADCFAGGPSSACEPGKDLQTLARLLRVALFQRHLQAAGDGAGDRAGTDSTVVLLPQSVPSGCNPSGQVLPKGSVIERIHRMQRLSFVDFSLVYDTYLEYLNVLDEQLVYSGTSATDITSTSIETHRLSMLRNYLLFCTAKDLSIMLAFRRLNPDVHDDMPAEYVIKISERLCFAATVSVSDLEPKRLRSIEEHRRRDANVLKSVVALTGH